MEKRHQYLWSATLRPPSGEWGELLDKKIWVTTARDDIADVVAAARRFVSRESDYKGYTVEEIASSGEIEARA